VNSENDDLRHLAEFSGTVAQFERQPLMYATSKPTERTILTAHSVYSQDRRIRCVFINSQGAHSVKSPVLRKQKLENPNRNTVAHGSPADAIYISHAVLALHGDSEFSHLAVTRPAVSSGKHATVLYHDVPETRMSKPVEPPPTLTLHKLTSTLFNDRRPPRALDLSVCS
jgi:hypothetical protein